MKRLLDNEPVAVLAAVRSLIVLACAFGAKLNAEQTAAVMLAAETVLALFTRARVSPVGNDTEPPSAPPEPIRISFPVKDSRRPGPPTAAMVALLVCVGCLGAPEKPACSQVTLAAITAECSARLAQTEPGSADEKAIEDDCDKRIDSWKDCH